MYLCGREKIKVKAQHRKRGNSLIAYSNHIFIRVVCAAEGLLSVGDKTVPCNHLGLHWELRSCRKFIRLAISFPVAA